MSDAKKFFRTVTCAECHVAFAVEKIPFSYEFEN